jgi:hypothetical protein
MLFPERDRYQTALFSKGLSSAAITTHIRACTAWLLAT